LYLAGRGDRQLVDDFQPLWQFRRGHTAGPEVGLDQVEEALTASETPGIERIDLIVAVPVPDGQRH
jgi:hypothetical protein